MKVLFVARHFSYFRNFDSVVVALAEAGHAVHLAADREEALGGRDLVERLAVRFPDRVTVGSTPAAQGADRYRTLARALRLGLDHVRYAGPRYAATPKIRERACERAPWFALVAARGPWRAAAARLIGAVERAVPRDPAVDGFLREQAPDLVLVTPLIELGSPQIDYLRAARALGLRTALPVWSWDHLSSKALIREVPDALLVWNEEQREEAGRFHGIAADRVIVTGAQCFDHWFDRQPSLDREAFCRRVGLPPDRAFVLYVCSSLFKHSPPEAPYIRRWIAAVRGSAEPRLRDAAILVRPHPHRMDEWRDVAIDEPRVAVWGANPVDPQSRADYFDSMYHAAAVVGLNTSALVEAAIVDRPVFAVLDPVFRDNQEGTFHFHHLLEQGGGFLHTADSLAAHATQLGVVLAEGPARDNRPFVERFIRPRGLAAAATPVFVAAVETLAGAAAPAPRAEPAWTWLLRPVVAALAQAQDRRLVGRVFWTPVRRRKWAGIVQATRDKDAYRRGKQRDKLGRVLRKAPGQAMARGKTVVKHALGLGGSERSSR
jgi:hypothetical protein